MILLALYIYMPEVGSWYIRDQAWSDEADKISWLSLGL